jgi:hypothetical protein
MLKVKRLPIFSDLQNHQAQECIVQRAEQKVLIGQGLNLPTVVLSQSVAGLLAIALVEEAIKGSQMEDDRKINLWLLQTFSQS